MPKPRFLLTRGAWLAPLSSLCLALPVGAAWAVHVPDTSACRNAVEALEQAEDGLAARAASTAVRPSAADVAARLKPLRQRVADACLGGMTTSPPPSQRTWTPPPAAARAQPLPPRTQPASPPPLNLPRADPPVTITHCTAATCVASDGSTLTRVGPGLVSPKGRCTVQGVFLRCP